MVARLATSVKYYIEINYRQLLLLIFLITLAYANSLNNEFLSDDIRGIAENTQIGDLSYTVRIPPLFFQPVLYFLIHKFFGLAPIFFRIPNIIFHMGVVFLVYLIVDLIIGKKTALIAAILAAIHPLQTEPVVWISGGVYVWYSFFVLLAFALHILSGKNKWLYAASVVSFLLALTVSATAMVWPFILLIFMIAFGKLKNDWKKLIAPLALSLTWMAIFVAKIPQRAASVQAMSGADKPMFNPLVQIPVAISSYLEMIFWPQNLTLYHSEIMFSKLEFAVRAVVVVLLIILIVWAFLKKRREIFFFLSFFVISLLPTLTPFKISWVVAERYAYLGTIGIYVIIAMGANALLKRDKIKIPLFVLGVFVGVALIGRTISRNIDWKNQDNLWLSGAKTSPHSPQNRNNLGDYYARRQNFPRAIQEFTIATELKPCYADAHHNVANVYARVGNAELAVKNYERALECNPSIWQSHQNVAAIYFKLEKYELAIYHIQKALKLYPLYNTLQEWLKESQLKLVK
jgi:hypothetical protein